MPRIFGLSLLSALAALALAAPTALAATYHVGTADGYPDLQAVQPLVEPGDTVYLHKDDASLVDPLISYLPGRIAVESVGGKWTIDAKNIALGSAFFAGDGGSFELKNVVLVNSPLSALSGSVNFVDTTDSRLTNVDIRDSDIGLFIYASGANTSQTTVEVDSSSGASSTWDAANAFVASVEDASSKAKLTVDVAKGKTFDMRGGMYAEGKGEFHMVKTGAGTWKVRSDPKNNVGAFENTGAASMTVAEGKLELDPWSHLVFTKDGKDLADYGTVNPDSAVRIKSGAVFKPTVTPIKSSGTSTKPVETAFSSVIANNFVAEAGARLEIGNASLLKVIGPPAESKSAAGGLYSSEAIYIGMIEGVTGEAVFSDSFKLDNRFIKAGFVKTSGDASATGSYNLAITHLSDITQIYTDLGYGVDIYRKMTRLSEDERERLDSLYARGYATDSDRAYLSSVGGNAQLNALHTVMDSHSHLRRALRDRGTRYFVSDPEPFYAESPDAHLMMVGGVMAESEIWGSVGQRWTELKDSDIAGYRYDPTTLDLGYEIKFGGVLLGAALQYDMGKVKANGGHAKTDVDALTSALYAQFQTRRAYVNVGALLGWGWYDQKISYPGGGGSYSSDFDSYSWGGNAEIGFLIDDDDWDMPFISVLYAGIDLSRTGHSAFTEKGSGGTARRFNHDYFTQIEMPVGLRFYQNYTNERGLLFTPSIDLGYAHMLVNQRPGSSVHFVSLPNQPWTAKASRIGQNAVYIAPKIYGRLGNFDMALDYAWSWRQDYSSHQANLTFGWLF